MSPDQRDLRDLFAAVGAEERAAADPLDVAALLGRAHRQRAVRGTTYSAIGLGAAAAIALGAASADGLWRDDVVPPPATQTPTEPPERTDQPRSTPSATPTATPTEAAWAPNWALCGTPAEDLWGLNPEDAPDETGGWWAESAWPWDTSVSPDAGFTLALTALSPGDAGPATARIVDLVAVAMNADGTPRDREVVVGVAATPLGGASTGTADADTGLPLAVVDTAIVPCTASPQSGGTGAADTPLAPPPTGTLYWLLAVVEATPEGQAPITFVSMVGTLGDLPPAPPVAPWLGFPPAPAGAIHYFTPGTPLRLTGDQLWTHAHNPGPYACMEGWLGPFADDYPDTPVQITGTPTLRDGELVVRLTLTNTSSADVLQSFVINPQVTVYRNGKKVGFAYGEPPDGTAASFLPPGPAPEGQWYDVGAWPAGQTYEFEFSLGTSDCKGQPWDAGEYRFHYAGQLMRPGPDKPIYDIIASEMTTTAG